MMNADRVILGRGLETTMDCQETGINNNQLVVGTSGTGKTLSVVVPRMNETKNSSLIVTVAKRELVEMYAPVFRKRGYKVYDLNFANPLKTKVGYDPLYFIKTPQDITCLARAIVMADERKNNSRADPYWDNAAISLLSSEIGLALSLHGNDTPSFVDVLDLHDKLEIKDDGSLIHSTLDQLFRREEARTEGKSFAVRCFKSFSTLPARTAGCVFSSLNITLDTIFTPEIRSLIRKGRQVNFEAIGNEKSVLFVTTSPVNRSLNAFVNLFYSQAFKSLYEYAESLPGGTLPVPTHIICDDFAASGKIEGFAELISVMRAKNMSATLLLQSDSQLVGMYGEANAVTIRNNCDCYLYLGGNDLQTARDISMRLNLPAGALEIIFTYNEYFRVCGKDGVTLRLEAAPYRAG
ncbi:MAG: type IV secretory system conjugative DNA transfer family protein, partial [Blautia sp.]|nr:type IV secretory system conjugative DNA transfer family protein [Blautia sp.]